MVFTDGPLCAEHICGRYDLELYSISVSDIRTSGLISCLYMIQSRQKKALYGYKGQSVQMGLSLCLIIFRTFRFIAETL